MAQIIFGVGASHTTLMNTQWAKVDHLPRAHAFRNALGTARTLLAEAKPDVVVILGSNHFRGFWLDLMPAFTIGVGDIQSAGEHGTPAGTLPSDRPFALDLCRSLIDAGIDIAFSDRIAIDHGISHAFQWVIGEDTPIPIVPIVVNCFAPPLPSLSRVVAVGHALRDAITALGTDKRVAIVATGGLSHRLPFPDWRRPVGEDEEFLARSWSEGRHDWKQFEVRRREIVVAARPGTNPAFDRRFLERLEAGTLSSLASELSQPELEAAAGNGGNEIRAWLMLAAAMNDAPGRTLAYSDMPEWLTGMAVAVIEPDEKLEN
ncbi:catechol 1,2-dioxygenase [Tardibacter chloracetimidivorans]|uniref:Catechol 1,2-dioxygenase n=1 Tax=Tardibacter chloracetimidivorans TaxID=1921510 RepID=A0A1L3ZW48_9SPHN|nr:catechol 1,2-dioxygenase [Tardibacter chloracetimidivorans]API59835.1 catechol 1,2-dioxygenase [Tardibacter chloracetimidivorans]